MALTKDQWYQKLRSWVPSWVFEDESSNVALFMGMAKLLEALQDDVDNLKAQTFIDEATAPYLDLLGNERSVARVSGELNPSYRVRIKTKSLKSQVSVPDLASIVNQMLIRGVCAIKEDFQGSVFLDRESFLNRGEIILTPIHNTFSIVVDKQIHEPFSFVDREYFADSEDFVGAADSNEKIFELIVEAVNENKAFGTLYRIVERIN